MSHFFILLRFILEEFAARFCCWSFFFTNIGCGVLSDAHPNPDSDLTPYRVRGSWRYSQKRKRRVSLPSI